MKQGLRTLTATHEYATVEPMERAVDDPASTPFAATR